MEVMNLPMAKIQPSPRNPRKTFDQQGIEELAENIAQQGLLQPITVRPVEWEDIIDTEGIVTVPRLYEIVCGERRYRAMKSLADKGGRQDIPCIVREMTDDEALDAMITENLQRADVEPLEEAYAFQQLSELGQSIEEIAARFGKSPKFVLDRIKLNSLVPELMAWLKEEKLPLVSAIILSKLDEENQRKFASRYGHMEHVGKRVAKGFLNEVFRHIANSPWGRDKEAFAGGCGVECGKCPFNSANAGCLFNDADETGANAKCTNEAKYEDKLAAYAIRKVLQEPNLARKGDALNADKTYAFVAQVGHPLMKRIAEELSAKGVMVVTSIVSKRCWDTGDRLKERIENKELVKFVCIEPYGCNVAEAYYLRDAEGNASEPSEYQITMLKGQYEYAYEKEYRDAIGRTAAKFADEPPATGFLTDEEQVAIHTTMLEHLSDKVKRSCCIDPDEDGKAVYEFVKTHPEQWRYIEREWLKEEIRNTIGAASRYGTDSEFAAYADLCDRHVNAEYHKAMVNAEVIAEKRQKEIAEELKSLGYDTNGNRIKEGGGDGMA